MEWGTDEFLCQCVITTTLSNVRDIYSQDCKPTGCEEEFFGTARVGGSKSMQELKPHESITWENLLQLWIKPAIKPMIKTFSTSFSVFT